MPDRLLLVLQPSHLRNISEAEALPSLPTELRGLPRAVVVVDMRPFEGDVEGGYWDRSEGYIISKAQEVRAKADESDDPIIAYFGLAEVPHQIALGAYIGDERPVLVYDRYGTEDWSWPAEELTIAVREPLGIPAERVDVAGEAVLRVEVSYPVRDEDVDTVVPRGRLADVSVGVEAPARGVIRSRRDVDAVRSSVRDALGALRAARPGLERIHLFCPAPASVCFAVGQELQIRNGVPVVTYRHRSTANGPQLRQAIVVTPGEASAAARPLTEGEVAAAREVREGAWSRGLDQVIRYSLALQRGNRGQERGPWYAPLQLSDEIAEAAPFPPLPPLWALVNPRSAVDPEPLPGIEPPYQYPETSWAWQLTDRLLLAQRRGAAVAVENGEDAVDEALLERLVRLFLFHESVHKHHRLTKYTAEGVGRFPNVLERLDYMADVYAALHELDYTAVNDKTLPDEAAIHDELVVVLDDVLRSHWAFVDADATAPRWQVRHIRRFLNWYWRWVQVNRARRPGAGGLRVALRALAVPPAIEIAGLEQQVSGRRVFARLDRLDPTTQFSLALVLENANFLDLADEANVNLRALMDAFARRDHEEIKSFFQTVFEKAEQAGGALPEA